MTQRTPCPHCNYGLVYCHTTVDPSERPQWRECIDCDGTGYAPEPEAVDDCDELVAWGMGVALLIGCAFIYQDVLAVLL